MNNVSFLGDLCDITTGSLDSNAFVEYGQYPFYTCAEHPLSIDSYAFDDDVVLVAGNNARGNFHVNRFIGKFNAYQRTYILKSKGAVPIDYIYYVLRLALKRLKDSSQGSQTKFLTIGILKEIPVLYNENVNTIASILATLDSKIELNNRINTQLEQMAKTIYDYWFVQFDFPANLQGAALSGTKGYKSSGGKMLYNIELKRDIPEGWDVKNLHEIANITMGQSPDGDSYNENENGTIFFQGSTDFGWRFPTMRQYTTKPSRFAKVGDILLSVRAPVGTINVADSDCCIGRGLAALNSKDGYTSYLFYVMEYFKRIFDNLNNAGTTFGSMTKDDLYTLKVVYPKLKLLERYNKIVGKYNNLILINNKQNQQLASLRDWLLPMLMNGQVTVKEAEEKLNSMNEFNQSIAAEPQAEYHK
jgi:type I restriction enzyme S subunit